MNWVISFILLFLGSLCKVSGQSYEISALASFETFNMNSMRSFQEELYQDFIQNIDVPFDITDDFNGNVGINVEFIFSKHKSQFGGFINSISTGGRISYADFSGSLNMDNLLRCTSVGGIYYYSLNGIHSKFSAFLGLSAGVSFIDHQLNYEMILSGSVIDSNEISFTAKNISFNPRFKLSYILYKRIQLTSIIGYKIDIPGTLYLKENSDAHLLNSSGDKVRADFSGVRLAVGIGLKI